MKTLLLPFAISSTFLVASESFSQMSWTRTTSKPAVVEDGSTTFTVYGSVGTLSLVSQVAVQGSPMTPPWSFWYAVLHITNRTLLIPYNFQTGGEHQIRVGFSKTTQKGVEGWTENVA